jgi:outer membrane murein-binding lipoprotein Lpp
VIEIYAAILGALLGVGGTGAIMTFSGAAKRNTESREAVIRLTSAVESIAGKLEELHQDMKADRKEIYTRLNQQGERITVLENKSR